MTQAFNLSQFANKLNSSGQADATTSLTGLVPTANLGTGTANSSSFLAGDQTYKAITTPRSGATTTSTASNVTLTSSSNQIQNITMTATGLYVILPDATTLTNGSTYFQIYNAGYIPFGIKDASGNILGYTLTALQSSICSLTNNATAAGIWAIDRDPTNFVQAQVVASSITAETTTGYIKACLLTTSSFIVVYSSGTAVKAIGGTISGSTITYGSAITISGTTTDNAAGMSIAKTGSTTCVAAWTTGNNATFKAVSLSLSGSTVTAGTPTSIRTSDTAGVNNNSYVFSLGGTTAIFICGFTSSSGSFTVTGAGTSSGTTLTVGTQTTLSSVDSNYVCAAPATSSSYLVSFLGTTTRYITVSGTTLTSGANFTGTNAGTTSGLKANSFFMPSAYLTATTALYGDKLVTWSGTTISSIVSQTNTCIGTPNSTIGSYQYGNGFGGPTGGGTTSFCLQKQFVSSTTNVQGNLAPIPYGDYEVTSDGANYVLSINAPPTSAGNSFVGVNYIKVV